MESGKWMIFLLLKLKQHIRWMWNVAQNQPVNKLRVNVGEPPKRKKNRLHLFSEVGEWVGNLNLAWVR